MKAFLLRIFASLGVAGVVAGALALLFFSGELRELFRGARTPPGTPVQLEDSPAVDEDVDRRTIPDCQVGQGLEVLEPKPGELAKWEKHFQRDLDGDFIVGHVTPRQITIDVPPRVHPGWLKPAAGDQAAAPTAPPEAAELEPELEALRGQLVLARKTLEAKDAGARGGEFLVTAPAAGGPVEATWTAAEVPVWEWLHELEFGAETSLPVGDKGFGEELRLDAGWTMLRRGPAYLSLLGWAERPDEFTRQALGREVDYGARLRLEVRCRSLLKLDCEAR